MANGEGSIEVQVERTGTDGGPVRKVVVDISGGCTR